VYSKIDCLGSKINREVDTIPNVADEFKNELLAALRRLDAILNK